MTVITISRQYGSMGDALARLVCDELSLRYFDKQLMADVAHDVGLSSNEIVDFSESNYKVRSFLDRLLRRNEVVSETTDPHADQLDENLAITLVQATIQAAYRQGNLVIVGRGGQVLLRRKPDVLHVRVEAPLETRVQRVSEMREIPLEAADQLVQERDRAAASYLHRFYGIDWYDPWLYHMVLNSGILNLQAAKAAIVAAVQHMEA